MNEEMKLLLRSNQLIIRDRNWNNGDAEAKAKAIDEQITDLLNPKEGESISEKTRDTLTPDTIKNPSKYDDGRMSDF